MISPAAARAASPLPAPDQRALGPTVWGRKVAQLPSQGTLLVCTDLQGNLRDYRRMRDLFDAEEAAGNDPILAFCGDLVHGPSPDLLEPGAWPDYLGTPYADESADLLRTFERDSRTRRMFSLMGNHEHSHVGGPVVPKFWPDEAAVLDAALGADRLPIHGFLRQFPLLAVGECGVVLTHGAPAAAEAQLSDYERFDWQGYESLNLWSRHKMDGLSTLLWARYASGHQAQALLRTCHGQARGFVAFGHDVVHHGYERFSREQICVSTSFGLHDPNKRYLRIDLAGRYTDAEALREGHELLWLWGAPPG